MTLYLVDLQPILLGAVDWQKFPVWMFVVAAFASVACALNGSFLVLKRMSLMGDAISHSVLPGLVVAFVLTGSRASGVMFLGAVVVGLLTTWLIQVLQNDTRVGSDTSMGVVFSSLFALGIVLLKLTNAGKVDLDSDCVLQGNLINAINLTRPLLGFDVPQAAISLGIVAIVNVAVVCLFWKELQICSFDEQFAETVGMRPHVMHYILMALTALTTVASFEAVGSILVIAMLIVPGATAHMLTDRLRSFVLVTVVVGLLTAFMGILLGNWGIMTQAGSAFDGGTSSTFGNIEPSALMAVCGGCLFLMTALFAPRYGAVSAGIERAKQSVRILCEDLLAMYYRLEELVPNRRLGGREAVQAVGGGPLAWISLWLLRYRKLVTIGDEGYTLTGLGRQSAANLVRSHRLWESWLVKHLDLPLDHVHSPAERMEHFIGGQIAEQLKAEVGEDKDPHGRSIPQD